LVIEELAIGFWLKGIALAAVNTFRAAIALLSVK